MHRSPPHAFETTALGSHITSPLQSPTGTQLEPTGEPFENVRQHSCPWLQPSEDEHSRVTSLPLHESSQAGCCVMSFGRQQTLPAAESHWSTWPHWIGNGVPPLPVPVTVAAEVELDVVAPDEVDEPVDVDVPVDVVVPDAVEDVLVELLVEPVAVEPPEPLVVASDPDEPPAPFAALPPSPLVPAPLSAKRS
jgi:hypothetical protein